MILTLPAGSLDYVRAAVVLDRDGAAIDPTSPALAVEMAFPYAGQPAQTWLEAGWESDGRGGWRARCLVGTGGTAELSAGRYDVWVRVTSSPEVPIRQSADTLRIV